MTIKKQASGKKPLLVSPTSDGDETVVSRRSRISSEEKSDLEELVDSPPRGTFPYQVVISAPHSPAKARKGSDESLLYPIQYEVHSIETGRKAVRTFFSSRDPYDKEEWDALEEDLQAYIGNEGRSPWRFRQTMAYWVSICCIFGALLFTQGAFCSFLTLGKIRTNAYVNYPYFVGSIVFCVGAAAAYLEVINAKYLQGDTFIWFYIDTRSKSWWAVSLFLFGAILFNFNTAASILPVSFNLEWGSAFIASICFAIAGLIEWTHNKGYRWRPSRLAWWIAYSNTIGGFAFLLGSTYAYFKNPTSAWGIDVPYLIGSVAYLVTGILGLIAWKLEQYGNAFLPYMNFTPIRSEVERRRTVQIAQLPFLVLYVVVACLSVTAISLATECQNRQVKDQLFNLWISIGIIVLGSALHEVPEAPPYSYLMWFMRMSMVWLLVDTWINLRSMSCEAE